MPGLVNIKIIGNMVRVTVKDGMRKLSNRFEWQARSDHTTWKGRNLSALFR